MINYSRLKGLDSTKVKNAFFSNYLAALIMLRLHDLKGLTLVKDKSHSKLSKFDPSMSDLNFWGRVLFHPYDPIIKRNLQYGHAEILDLESGRISTPAPRKLSTSASTRPSATRSLTSARSRSCGIVSK